MTYQSMRRTRPRVLLVAEQANPEGVSVSLEGWSHSRAIARHVDALTVTQVRNREAFLRAGLREGDDADFVTIDSEAVARPLNALANLTRGGKGKGWTTVMAFRSLAYYAFERQLWKRFGPEIRRGAFDIVHRLTPLSPTVPSPFLARGCARAGVPFVLGPLNGGVPWPRAYDSVRRAEREWLSYVRGAYRLLPGYRSTRRHAAAILVGSRDTFEQLDGRYHDKAHYVPENAIDADRFARRRARRARRPLRVVFVGRLVPYKGADVLIEAAAPLVRNGEVTVEIIGDGPQMPRLREMVREGGLGAGVTLAGRLPHESLQDRLAESDVFGFPSIREFGGAVVLEAMAVGLVPVVVGYGGPAELVSPATGIAIPIVPRDELVRRFRSELAGLVAEPERVDALGQAASWRALTHFTWDAKATSVMSIYQWLLDPRHTPMPRHAIPIPDDPITVPVPLAEPAAE